MSLYVHSSALLKRYVDEPDSEAANALLDSDPCLLTARPAMTSRRSGSSSSKRSPVRQLRRSLS